MKPGGSSAGLTLFTLVAELGTGAAAGSRYPPVNRGSVGVDTRFCSEGQRTLLPEKPGVFRRHPASSDSLRPTRIHHHGWSSQGTRLAPPPHPTDGGALNWTAPFRTESPQWNEAQIRKSNSPVSRGGPTATDSLTKILGRARGPRVPIWGSPFFLAVTTDLKGVGRSSPKLPDGIRGVKAENNNAANATTANATAAGPIRCIGIRSGKRFSAGSGEKPFHDPDEVN